MKKFVSVISAMALCFGALSAYAAVPQVPEDETSIYIANGGLHKINKNTGSVRDLLEETPRDVYVKDGKIYCVMARELPDEGIWIDSAYRLNADGTIDELLSEDYDVDVFRMNDDFWYYTIYYADSNISVIFKENGFPFAVDGRVMDMDWKSGFVYSYNTIMEGDNPHREVYIDGYILNEDFDYPEYIYNYCVNGQLFSKTYYGSTAYLYRRTADMPERELLIEDFLDYAVSDDGRYVYFSRSNGSAVTVLRYDTETEETVTIIESTDDFAMGSDCIYSFNANRHERYTFDGELIGSVELGGGVELELQIGSDSMFVNGQEQKLIQPPVIRNDRTLVPFRAIFEALGCDVEWDGEERRVTAIRKGFDMDEITTEYFNDAVFKSTADGLGYVSENIEIELLIEHAIMSKTSTYLAPSYGDFGLPHIYGWVCVEDKEEIELDSPPVIINDSTMVPVRAISETLGCTVDWNEETQTVSISS